MENFINHKLLIANRGEIVIRIARAADELNIPTLSIYSEDDADSMHTQVTDEAVALEGRGAKAYLDIDQIVNLAKAHDCTMIHPGYGFLSESDAFAQSCAEEDILFIGPRPEVLDLFGNKIEARRLADNWGVPTIEGTLDKTTLEEAIAFFESLGEGASMMIKAVAGGGGRGMRLVTKLEDIPNAFMRCQSEAEKFFGNGDLYVERYIPKARHIEVQIIGDGENVSHLGERECSIQRRNQKIIEIAPCPGLSKELKKKLTTAAVLLAKAVQYNSVGTVEFLVEGGEELDANTPFYFIEANPRLQVEHTITEEVMGVDLLLFQLQEAMGIDLEVMGLLEHDVPEPEGYAMQLRINTEHISETGAILPKSGKITQYDLPEGEGIRVDGYGYEGYQTNPNFDSLLLKLICHVPYDHFGSIIEKTLATLEECEIKGVDTNISFLKKILNHPRFQAGDLSTNFVGTHIIGNESIITPSANKSSDSADFSFNAFPAAAIDEIQKDAIVLDEFPDSKTKQEEAGASFDEFPAADASEIKEEGIILDEFPDSKTKNSKSTAANLFSKIETEETEDEEDDDEPDFDSFPAFKQGRKDKTSSKNKGDASKSSKPEQAKITNKKTTSPQKQQTSNRITLPSPTPGSVVSLLVKEGDTVKKGQELVVLEAMKMESVILANQGGIVDRILVKVGDIISEDQAVLQLNRVEGTTEITEETTTIDPDYVRPDLKTLIHRKSFLLDKNRPDAIAKRRRNNQFTARENIEALCDADSFIEYGGLAVAAQKARRSEEDLIKNTPADGLVTGIGTINQSQFEAEKRCLVMAYDFTVLAGTQGTYNHMKMDRMLHLAEKWKLPIILFAEGGGGRPGDVDVQAIAGLHILTFTLFGALSGKVPLISIVSRYCFAGNAALAGCSDVIIATENVSIGMGGPAMIEGGGLGTYHPREVGPAAVQTKNGVIDILVKDEMEAVAVAKKYLSYFQGVTTDWTCSDQRLLRQAIPENRRRVYDIRKVITQLADTDSVLELRPHYGVGMITSFIRIEGHPIGLIANNPNHLGGAINAEGAIKADNFLSLCSKFGIPILSLCDTPGIMVGPDAEKEGTVRHASRLFVTGGQLKVPLLAIVLRKGYGLGAMAMVGGSFHVPLFTVAWPTGEFGAMGIEGSVHLGYRKELEAVKDPVKKAALFDKMVAELYERGKGINMASQLEIDDVIDPMESRKWIVRGLKSV